MEQYPYCGGVFQSPVNIKSDLLRFNPTLGPIEVRNYNLLPSEQLTLVNDGHSGEYKLSVKSRFRKHIYNNKHEFSIVQHSNNR